mgnify:CR=1 FL=1
MQDHSAEDAIRGFRLNLSKSLKVENLCSLIERLYDCLQLLKQLLSNHLVLGGV